ncbi:bifunctional 3-(3-hydroxy-phenyl)propionate/3-hydroxycinnamic acid hydroxylase [Streptomyces adustus]|uniref:Bifunctional 3-(3-hydroxy-phenyl)propionate/3-hydroxycinnamic acid hydroxylase n=1 Tax=Streptomyces adustus TaxID=1609272 RepID=A0A5N8VHZ8_9ACTN|nr:bifunctional 3-(3-hydroxy-phenyl)propionate/3-hydroxycinnamic acid hydroxylase [Streptomyces adustus]MPY33714.1 bifunctional 3-(3-hydroxy-phenyl)propionate/3-hydroxycinnamic acid hydroxylase [Streptomyces adustus]
MPAHCDVLIVGYGPVGQLLALLLADRGRTVTVVERWPQAYPMPRAVAFDGEGARTLSAAGIGGLVGRIGEPSGAYLWQNADGQVLLHIDGAERKLAGWPESTSMYQPALEAEMEARGAGHGNITVHRGHEVVRIDEDSTPGGTVRVTATTPDGGELLLSASWVVGCDGANSFVRRAIGTEMTDLGFSHDWLVCDVVHHDGRTFDPNNLQICDPARPRTSVSAGPGNRRYEFMRLAGETVEQLNTTQSCWELLKLFDVSPADSTLRRHHVYSFRAGSAEQWHRGRLVIAGDAAHVMPPFAGQGMSSGFRDAGALAWRLDALLAGQAGPEVLDHYTQERRTHVRHAITMSVNLGRIICQTDPKAAADRDLVMKAAAERAAAAGTAPPQRSPLQPLTKGFLHHAPNGRPAKPAGALAPQARIAQGNRSGLFDDIVGLGFVLLTTEDPELLLTEADFTYLAGLGTRIVRILASGTDPARTAPGEVVDLDDVYLPFLTAAAATTALIRPDFYVYGTAAGPEAVRSLLDGARTALRATAAA